jgi:hypothetical protein
MACNADGCIKVTEVVASDGHHPDHVDLTATDMPNGAPTHVTYREFWEFWRDMRAGVYDRIAAKGDPAATLADDQVIAH